MRHYRRHKRSQHWQGVAILSLSFIVMGGVGYTLWVSQDAPRDEHTFCRTDQPPTEHKVIVVDQTDTRTETSNLLLQTAIKSHAASLKVDGRLTLAHFNGDGGMPRIALDICNIGTGADANRLVANPRRLRQKFEEQYRRPIELTAASISTETETRYSHLVKSLTTNAAYLAYQPNAVRPHFILFSDMRENNPEFSFYRKRPSLASFKRYLRTQDIHRLTAVDLTVVFTPIERKAPLRENQLRTFWTAALEAQGVSIAWERL